MIAGAKSKNPKAVVALDMAQDKLDLAKDCGADLIINIGQEDPVAAVQEMTGGYGADVYIEGTGHPSAVGQGLNLLRKLGTYVEYSVFGSDVTVDWSIISDDKELDVRGAHLGADCWPAAIRMLESGRLPMDRICTHQLPLADFQKGLDLVASGKESIKVSADPRRNSSEGSRHMCVLGHIAKPRLWRTAESQSDRVSNAGRDRTDAAGWAVCRRGLDRSAGTCGCRREPSRAG